MLASRKVQILILASWAAISILAGSVLTSFHQPFTLPTPGIVTLASGPPHTWRVLHVISDGCGCSRKISSYLSERAPLKGISEEVVFVGPPEHFTTSALFIARGFRVKTILPEDFLRQFDAKGVPLLVFLSPNDQIVYIGGYGMGSYRDEAIWSQIQAGATPPRLPVLGCAIGRHLKNQLDPLAWKY